MAEPANNPPAPKPALEQARQDESDIRNASERHNEALREHYSPKNHDDSLRKAEAADTKMFRGEQQNLDRLIAAAKDPAARQQLELRKKIEDYEYRALRGDRDAQMSETLTGRMNLPGRPIENEEADRQRKRAAELREQARVLRKEYRERREASAPHRGQAPQRDQTPQRDKAPQPTNDNSRERLPSEPAVQNQAGLSRPESIMERNSRLIKKQDFAARAKELTDRTVNREREDDGPPRGRNRDRYGPER